MAHAILSKIRKTHGMEKCYVCGNDGPLWKEEDGGTTKQYCDQYCQSIGAWANLFKQIG